MYLTIFPQNYSAVHGEYCRPSKLQANLLCRLVLYLFQCASNYNVYDTADLLFLWDYMFIREI